MLNNNKGWASSLSPLFCYFRLHDNLTEDHSGQVNLKCLLDKWCESNQAITSLSLSRKLKQCFPSAKAERIRSKTGTQQKETFYTGISLKDTTLACFAFENLEQFIPSSVLILKRSASKMVLGKQTSIIVNGITIFKEIHVRPTSWELVVRTKVINLDKHDISTDFSCDSSCESDQADN